VRDKTLPFRPSCIGEEEIAEVLDTLPSDWITTGPQVRRFEEGIRNCCECAGRPDR
jgi:dTDP-4-amino-4,6-dideoxygalactose transaminase